MDNTNITIPKKEIAPGVFTTGGVATLPTNSVAAASLQPNAKLDLTSNPPVDTSGADLVSGAAQNATQFDTDYQRILELQQQPAQSQNALNSALSELMGAEANLGGQGADQLSTEAQLGLPTLSKERAANQGLIKTGVAEYNAMKAEFDKLNADLEAGAGRKGLTTSALLGQQGAIERAKLARLNSKAAEIGILQAKDLSLAGDIEAAQRTADRAIDLKYKDREAVYTTKLNQYNRIKDFLTEDEKKRGKALEYALGKEAKALEEVKDFQKTILNNAISRNAPQKVLNAIVNGTSIEEITKAGKGYLKSNADILDEQLKIAQTASANRANQPSKERKTSWQTINGVPTLMDDQTGKPINEATANPKNVEESKANFQFLMDTAKKAQELSSASGKGQYRRELNEKVFGASSRTVQLENVANTLRTNMLILNTDPNVKKFFGPQMSNNDVKLMMAGGTTLDPTSQTPEDFKAEAIRIYDLVDRANKAVEAGIKADPTEAYYQESSSIITNTTSPKSTFLQEYNNRKKDYE